MRSKSCPHCGDEHSTLVDLRFILVNGWPENEDDDDPWQCEIFCRRCTATVKGRTATTQETARQLAFNRWNTRA